MKVFSFGGGVQSTAALVLAARGELKVDAFLFANVGDDSENPGTLRYVREVAKPYAAAHSLDLIELGRFRGGVEAQPETLYGRLKEGKRGVIIPAMLAPSGMLRRECTRDFKIAVINRWLRAHGARKQHPAIDMLGISLDEYQRMRTDSGFSYVRLSYPLIDRMLTRADCRAIIESEGLPVPPKSACWFCPFHSLSSWREMAHSTPDLFEQAVELDGRLNEIGHLRRRAYLYRGRLPLRQVISVDTQQSRMFDDTNDMCESGYCMV